MLHKSYSLTRFRPLTAIVSAPHPAFEMLIIRMTFKVILSKVEVRLLRDLFAIRVQF